MKLAKLLNVDRILLDMKATEHWAAIVELVDFLTEMGDIPKDCREPILTALEEREAQVSTGIGSGVAIPHTFSDTLEEVVAVFGRSKEGIDFEALDNAPVHFIILFIVPRKDYHLHLRTLAAIAKMFTNCEVRRNLATAICRNDILDILDPKPNRVVNIGTEPC
ncbi:MAG: PTS sugar transporter subunit IIA [Akkermansiaceae bacterium]|jgi:mannitol/fructose-specific phosphotransferase system IIA component (Ntr-type)|nr:PTS sugar transporter subunit IIA [Akkermansiaceae bacterium]MDP4646469.1 PTS sugar transporter subunit IIA [Akkermansiaceae bacterium]MDP4720503.1 PTS sugar transporter subunit IIA [Akkermansiaceae bacterium]MDP4780077.1 PTS sugar transporter subunit IIA [Akkermansiaceae bacterium]MDP4847670.1 PTS sugar transporter subunit IIA [Akkermansiaceae bacterium]